MKRNKAGCGITTTEQYCKDFASSPTSEVYSSEEDQGCLKQIFRNRSLFPTETNENTICQ